MHEIEQKRLIAQELAEESRLFMRAIRLAGAGWLRDFGVSHDGMIYTQPSQYSVTGVYPMPSSAWQAVTTEDLDGFMAAISATPKGVFGVAGFKILVLAGQVDELIAQGQKRHQEHEASMQAYQASIQARNAAPAVDESQIRCGTLYTDHNSQQWRAVSVHGAVIEFVPVNDPEATPVTLGKLRGTIEQPE